MIKISKVVLIVLVLLMAQLALGQLQRMGIAAGRFSLGGSGSGKSSASLRSYCLDYTRPAPGVGSSYSNVLSGGEQVSVRLHTPNGVVTKSLNHAIRDGDVAIGGQATTLGDLVAMGSDPLVRARMSSAERRQFDDVLQEWRKLTPAERAQIGSEVVSDSNHMRLQLQNKRPYKVDVEIGRPIAVGGQGDAAPSVDFQRIVGASPSRQVKEQGDIWREGNIRYQSQLKALGYYKGKIDGEFGPQSSAALKRFQAEHGLPDKPGVIDTVTEKTLLVQTDMADLRRLESQLVDHKLLYMDTMGSGPNLYTLRSVRGEVIYQGDDVAAAAQTISQRAGTRDVAITIVSDSPEVRVNNFTRTLNTQFQRQGTSRQVKGWSTRRSQGRLNLPSSAAIKQIDGIGPITRIATGPRKGWYQADVKTRVGTKKSIFKVIARTKEIVVQCVEKMKALVTQSGGSLSASAVASRAKSELKQQGIVDELDLYVQLESRIHVGRILSTRWA